MKRTLMIAAIASALSGCASTNTGIVQIADDTYMYARQDWMERSGGVVKAALYKEANAFCSGNGKKFEPLNSTAENRKPYQSWAGAEIQFACR